MMRKLFAAVVLCSAAYAQNPDPGMAISGGPASRGWTAIYYYTAIGGADYI
jgi:hypothetical protein